MKNIIAPPKFDFCFNSPGSVKAEVEGPEVPLSVQSPSPLCIAVVYYLDADICHHLRNTKWRHKSELGQLLPLHYLISGF